METPHQRSERPDGQGMVSSATSYYAIQGGFISGEVLDFLMPVIFQPLDELLIIGCVAQFGGELVMQAA